ncbi:MAG TPA: sensor domain-containing protein [Bryobacteraceae bacterium]|nr:sensor domain-containing protein [Bryobacteraceae bacterium]
MTAASALTPDSGIDRIFGPVLERRTYWHLLHAALSFPLGLLYFVIMIVGLSLGAGLAVLIVGFGILAVTLGVAKLFGRFERELSKAFLGATFEPRAPRPPGWRAMLQDRRAWTTVVYLLLRFPVGVAGLITGVLFLVSIPLMAAPGLYTMLSYSIEGAPINSSQEALLVSLFGCVLFLLCAHAANAIGAISRRLAMAML